MASGPSVCEPFGGIELCELLCVATNNAPVPIFGRVIYKYSVLFVSIYSLTIFAVSCPRRLQILENDSSLNHRASFLQKEVQLQGVFIGSRVGRWRRAMFIFENQGHQGRVCDNGHCSSPRLRILRRAHLAVAVTYLQDVYNATY